MFDRLFREPVVKRRICQSDQSDNSTLINTVNNSEWVQTSARMNTRELGGAEDAWPTTEELVSVAGPGKKFQGHSLRKDARLPGFVYGRVIPFKSRFLHISKVFELSQRGGQCFSGSI